VVVVTVGDPAVVDGALDVAALDGLDDDAPLATVAAPAPVTVRPALPVRDLVDRLHRDATPWVLVTTPDGALVGVVSRQRLLAMATADRLP
jgi:CBS domain-containing protein